MPILSVPQKKLNLTVAVGANLMNALISAQIPVASSCLGKGVCSKCAVKITPQGQASELELNSLARNQKSTNLRLSCQVVVTEDLTVETTYW